MDDRLARLVTWAVERRHAVVAAVFVLMAVAMVVATRLELDALPDVTNNQVVVLTRAPGLPPDDVERRVTRSLETALGGLPGVESQRSISRYGISSVVVVFEDGVDPWLARQRVQERVGLVSAELPLGVGPPELAPFTGGLGEVFQLTFASPQRSSAELRELVSVRVSPIFRAVPGVVETNLWGGEQRTFAVVGDPERMRSHGVALAALEEAVARGIGSTSGATLPSGPGQVYLRGEAWPIEAAGIAALEIGAAHSKGVRVADLASVGVSARPRIGSATRDGRGEVVYMMVQMARGENALTLSRALASQLEGVRAVLPSDVEVEVVYNRAELIESTMSTVTENLVLGALLVSGVLFLSLGSMRAGIVAALVIPLSLLGAVVGMVVGGVPGNLMSLGALDFGLLVDGAVVMVERAFHELARAPTNIDRARLRERLAVAMRGVARPMTFSVGIIVVVYLPILGLSGVDGKLFRPMAIAVVLALIVSLVLSLVFVPALAAIILRRRDLPATAPPPMRAALWVHARVLERCMRAPAAVFAVAVSALVSAGVAFYFAGASLVPQLDEGGLVIQTNRAADISLESSVAEGSKLEAALLEEIPEVRSVATRLGSPAVATDIMGVEQADVFVTLEPEDRWRPGLDRDGLLAEIEALTDRRDPGGEASITQPIQMRFNELLGGAVTDVTISVFGEDLELARATAERIVDRIASVSGVHDLRVLAPAVVPVVELRPRTAELAQMGLSPGDLLDYVRGMRQGIDVGEVWDGPVRVPVTVGVAAPATVHGLAALPVVGPRGELARLDRVASIETRDVPGAITRENGQRRVVVGFNVRGRSLGEVTEEARERLDAEIERPPGIRLVWGGQVESLNAATRRLAVVVPVALVAVVFLLIMAFRRVTPALVVLLNVPFALVGGIFALSVRSMPVSISAVIGFIALSGIAVLNGVVLMSTMLGYRDEGLSMEEAARRAALERARPVLMTALVAGLGFLPMALATGPGSEVQRPLATVVVAGLVTSTALTLVILPVLQVWWGRLRHASGHGGGRPS